MPTFGPVASVLRSLWRRGVQAVRGEFSTISAEVLDLSVNADEPSRVYCNGDIPLADLDLGRVCGDVV